MSQLFKLRHFSSSCRNAAPFRHVQSTLPFTQTCQSSTIRHHHFTTSPKHFHHPLSSSHSHPQQQQQQQQQQRFVTTLSPPSPNATSTTTTSTPPCHFRIALLLSDPQNNLLLVQKRSPNNEASSTTNGVIDAGSFISTVPHFLLKQPSTSSSPSSSLKQQKIRTSSSATSHHNNFGEITVVESDDPREAIIQYANEELWLDVDESVILPFTQFVTIDNKFISNVVGSNRCVNEQVLVYFVKVRRYFDPNEPLLDEHGRAIEHLVLPKERSLVVQCFTEDQIVQNLASNVYVNAANNNNKNSAAEAVTTTEKQRKRTANVFDTLSIAVLGKYLVERQENMYEAKRYFAQLRDIVLSSLLSCAVTFLVISYYMSSS